nr:hypothetical protein [uncultured Allomuricauda sp.]
MTGFMLNGLVWLVIFGLFSYGDCHGQSPRISISGAWSLVIRNDITEAGKDYTGSYSSDIDQTVISIRNANGAAWQILVRNDLSNWNTDFLLELRRTGEGLLEAGSTVSGGTVYTVLSANDQQFFVGVGNVEDIPVQYRLSNVSVVSQDLSYYQANVIWYTVVGL